MQKQVVAGRKNREDVSHSVFEILARGRWTHNGTDYHKAGEPVQIASVPDSLRFLIVLLDLYVSIFIHRAGDGLGIFNKIIL